MATHTKRKMLRTVLLISVTLISWASIGARASDAPPDIDDMVQQFNLENATEKIASSGEDEAITEDEYGIKSYEKSKTQFDGVTSEMQVSYLQLGREHGVEIPVLSTGTRNVNTDFTVMLWFKIDASYGKDHEESMAAS